MAAVCADGQDVGRVQEAKLDSAGRILRTGRYKYTRFSSGRHREQFFDTGLDPGEMNNLAEDPSHQEELARHRAMLDGWMNREGDPYPNPICAEDLTMKATGSGD